jgi:hypothetical protein
VAVEVDFAEDGAMRVRFSGRTWTLAHGVIEGLKEDPPDGYRLVSSQVTRRGSTRSGRRCSIRLYFKYVDSRVTPMTMEDGRSWFHPHMVEAQGG